MRVELEILDAPEEWTDRDWEEADAYISALQEVIEDNVRDYAGELETLGYAEIEYKNSDEVIDDTLIANEYEFDEEGNRV